MQQHLTAQESMLSPFGKMTTSDNYSLRYGIWRSDKAASRGTVILLNGRTEFMEKYAETISELQQRGFDVYSFDWRGQGLSSRMLSNRHKGFVKTYDDYISDLAVFVDEIVKPQAVSPLIIVAHSMGGHIAMRYLQKQQGVIERAVLLSPMINILTSPFPRWFARGIARMAGKAGWDQEYAISSGDYSPEDEKFEGNLLTSDPVRFLDEKRAIKKNPDLALGGVTYRWLSATFASIDVLAAPGFGKEITIPILMVSAGSDKIVSLEAQKSICARLQQCRSKVILEARHEILKETDVVRSIFWDEFDKFTAGPDSIGLQ
jgi:lysophospholipase